MAVNYNHAYSMCLHDSNDKLTYLAYASFMQSPLKSQHPDSLSITLNSKEQVFKVSDMVSPLLICFVLN